MLHNFTHRASTFNELPWFGDRLLNEWIVRMLRAHGQSICDVGTGTGLMIPYYLDTFAPIFVVEPNDEMRSQLIQQINDDKRVNIINAVAEALPLPDCTVDIVLSKNAFHHCSNRKRAVAEFSRVATRALAIAEVVIPHPVCSSYLCELVTTKEPRRAPDTVFDVSMLQEYLAPVSHSQWVMFHDQYIDLDTWIEHATVDKSSKKKLRQLALSQPDEVMRYMQIHHRNGRLSQLRRIALVIGFMDGYPTTPSIPTRK